MTSPALSPVLKRERTSAEHGPDRERGPRLGHVGDGEDLVEEQLLVAGQVEQALLAIPAVVACYLVSGSDDFLIEAAVLDLAGYEQLLLDQVLAIPDVTEARSTFAIRTVLSRGPLPLEHWR